MSIQHSSYVVNLFYSYSHKDSRHRKDMETSLALLKSNGILNQWSDEAIIPGKKISDEIRANINKAQIIVFLLSPDFIASKECMKEWRQAKILASDNPGLFRIPIIVRNCSWKDLLEGDDLKALPDDGTPVSTFLDNDEAWDQVYEGIKLVINQLRNTFDAKQPFLDEMDRTDFISEQHLSLQDLFVFPRLTCQGSQNDEADRISDSITSEPDLLKEKYVLIHGGDRSGKTALGHHTFLTLTTKSKPVLFVNLNEIHGKASHATFQRLYEEQFNGDYSIWSQQADRTVIMDNLTGRPELVDFVASAKDYFDRIFVTLSSSVYYAFYKDESRLADFEGLEIGALTHVQQEALIRKRLALTNGTVAVTDASVDRIEDRLNSIIVSDKVVPRYPFFVLCILQTYETYMPSGLAITSYGHCYYALIIASLVRAGISSQDSDITTCFNFAEHLAFEHYQQRQNNQPAAFDFDKFIENYRSDFMISSAIINRLKHRDFGLIDNDGQFRSPYMQYFFLGRFLSRDNPKSREIIERMCDAVYLSSNYLTLLFAIHHANNSEIIDNILLRTMLTLNDVQVAKLDRKETQRFQDIVAAIPNNILSHQSVEAEREQERASRDRASDVPDDADETDSDWTDAQEAMNSCYRVLKNNDIMGQILRNKYGSLTIRKIEEVVEIIADGGLRLVNFVLKDEREIQDIAHYLQMRNPEHDIEKIKTDLERFSFLWTMVNIERIVTSINVPEIRTAVTKVVKEAETPAYDVIGYFTLLDSAPELGEREKAELDRLLKKYRDPFVRGVLSIRTQHYMNTHRSNVMIEQAICSLLSIKYMPRLISPRR